MKIRKIDEDTRVVTFDDGFEVEVMYGWMRNGGWGWIKSGTVGHTERSIKRVANRWHRNFGPMHGSDPQFDYERQAWTAVVYGRRVYVRCGHPEAMPCGCYGREHAGEEVKR
jgi:hypothetical protein